MTAALAFAEADSSDHDLIDVSETARIGTPVRDVSQSEDGNVLDIAHPTLLDIFYSEIQAFNESGDNQIIDVVETPSGAQIQVDILYGRPPLETMRKIHQAMPKDVAARLLVRGPYCVGLEPLSDEDLYFAIKQMAIASGAEDGRKVIFKLFEAQNTPEEKLATYRILKMLRAEGYNVEAEDATCYTAEDIFDPSDTQNNIRESINNDAAPFIEYTESDGKIIKCFSLKDMIGGLGDPDKGPIGNATTMVEAMIDVLEENGQTAENSMIALHCHDTGFSTDAYVDAIIAAHKRGWKVRIDAMAGGISFAQIREVDSRLKAKGYDMKLNSNQLQSLERMTTAMEDVREAYKAFLIDTSLISPEECRYAHIPGGAVPTTFNKYIKKLSEERGINIEDAKNMIVENMRQAWEELGNPHSVTPGANNLGRTAFVMANNQLDGKEGVNVYEDLPADLINYWRGKMPTTPKKEVFELLCRQHLEYVLDSIVPEGELADSDRAALLSYPTNRRLAKSILIDSYGLTLSQKEQELFDTNQVRDTLEKVNEYDFYLKIDDQYRKGDWDSLRARRETLTAERDSLIEELRTVFRQQGIDYDSAYTRKETAESILDNFGQRQLSISANIQSRIETIKADIDYIKGQKLVRIDNEDDIIFSGLCMAPANNGGIHHTVANLVYLPRNQYPGQWPEDPGFTKAQEESPTKTIDPHVLSWAKSGLVSHQNGGAVKDREEALRRQTPTGQHAILTNALAA